MSTNRTDLREDLKNYIYNPEMAQFKMLEYLEDADEDKLEIISSSSPFLFLLEASATLTSEAATESINTIRTKYPNLAATKKDLFHHISDAEIDGIFSKPGDVEIGVFVTLTDIISYGYRTDNMNYYEVTIPKDTEIKIKEDIPLTLLNDIVIKYYDNDTVFVEHIQNNSKISIKDQGVLESDIITQRDGYRFVYFTTKIKQVQIIKNEYPSLQAEGFIKDIMLDKGNKFYHCNVYYANQSTNNRKTYIPVSYNESYIDPMKPTAYVSISDSQDDIDRSTMRVFIPDVYFQEHDISGNIYVDVYQTLGNIYLPLGNISTSEYSYTLGDTSSSPSVAVMPKVTMFFGSNSVLCNGTNGLSFSEIKEAVINNTLGEQVLPITDKQLNYSLALEGFEIFKTVDTITERTYIATRNIDKKPKKNIMALQDVYFNNVDIYLDKLKNNRFISHKDEYILLKSNSIYKDVNSRVELISNEEYEDIKNMSTLDKIEYLKLHKYFYTPYYYQITRDINNSNVKVFDYDNPVIDKLKIIGVNENVNFRVNIRDYYITKIDTGYRIFLELIANDELENYDKDKLKITIAIPLVSNNMLYIDGVYDEDLNYYIFNIDSSMITNKDNEIELLNGIATTNINYSKLNFTMEIFTYVINMEETPDTAYLNDKLPFVPKALNPVILTYEHLYVSLGTQLNNIWTALSINYTERKYLRYKNDVYNTYETDVYATDPKTGAEFLAYTNPEDPSDYGVSFKILHKKGDKILDEDGKPILKHKKNDLVLDNNYRPIVDDIGGVIRSLDICMLDYEFLETTQSAYELYNKECLKELKEYINTIIPNKNKNLLDKTKLLYKSYKTAQPLLIKLSDSYLSIPYITKPHVTLYYKQNQDFKLSSKDYENIEATIGNIIDKHLNNGTVVLNDIKKEIKETLGESVASVKIEGMDPYNTEIISFKDKSSRLSLSKQLYLNDYKQVIVKYNFNITVQVI